MKYENVDGPRRNNGINWDAKRKAEEFSKNLGYRNRKVLEERLWIRSLGGPASGPEISSKDFTTTPPCER